MDEKRTSSVPANRFVEGQTFVEATRWDAAFHLDSLEAGKGWALISELAAGGVTEGLRLEREDSPPGEAPLLYRHSHLGAGVILPDREHLTTHPRPSSRSVGLGDLIISKSPPTRTAWITPAVPRHTPDSGLLRVVAPGADLGLWIASVIAHPGFAGTLMARHTGAVIPRLRASDVAGVPVPPVPMAELARLAAQWAAADEARLAALRVQAELFTTMQELADELGTEAPQDSKARWLSSARMPESWAPEHAGVRAFQDELETRGWTPLSHYLAPDAARLRRELPASYLLHLSDADDWLSFRALELLPVREATFHLYADPLRRGEVLLSTLGSAPKVVFVPPSEESLRTIWLSDVWVRLSARAPGALALMLGTRQVQWQLARAASGAIRQFVARSELADIRVPPLSNADSDDLHSRLVVAMQRRERAERELERLRAELDAMVSTALGGAT